MFQINDSHIQEQGSLSVPSKSPELSRRGSFSDTYMAKNTFWSHSLPRSKRRVTFTDQENDDGGATNKEAEDLPPPPLPSRPPPPAPVRGQSISTMKDMSSFSQTYNTALQERSTNSNNTPTIHSNYNNGSNNNVSSNNTTANSSNYDSNNEKNNNGNSHGTEDRMSSTADSGLTSLASVEYRQYAASRSAGHTTTRDDTRVDMGPARDPWQQLYGDSVLNNTLHER